MTPTALGGGKFGDDWNKFEHFTQTTTVQYKAEMLGGTFAPSTPWKSITIHCNGDFALAAEQRQSRQSQPAERQAAERGAGADHRDAAAARDASSAAYRLCRRQGRGRRLRLPPSTSPIQKSSTSFHCVKVAQVPDRRIDWQASHASMPRRPMVQIKTAPGPRPQPMHRPFMRAGFR